MPSRAAHGALVATVVTTVTFDDNITSVEVINRSGSSDIFFSVDGTTPTIAGDFYVVAAGVGTGSTPARTVVRSGVTEVIKLISGGTPTYSVHANPV